MTLSPRVANWCNKLDEANLCPMECRQLAIFLIQKSDDPISAEDILERSLKSMTLDSN